MTHMMSYGDGHPCARPDGHSGLHLSYAARARRIEYQRARRQDPAAREWQRVYDRGYKRRRYNEDPAYAEQRRERNRKRRENPEYQTWRRAYMRDYTKRTVAHRRAYNLSRKYGLTVEELETRILAQGGVCAICHERTPVHVDHDHNTGLIRGILCSNCNTGIGLLADDPERLEAALAYINGSLLREVG